MCIQPDLTFVVHMNVCMQTAHLIVMARAVVFRILAPPVFDFCFSRLRKEDHKKKKHQHMVKKSNLDTLKDKKYMHPNKKNKIELGERS